MKKYLGLIILCFIASGCNLKFKTTSQRLSSSQENKTSEKPIKQKKELKKVTLNEILDWDSKRYCTSYILTGKLIADYYSPEKPKKEHFSGSIYIEYSPGNFKITIYDKYNQKIFEKTISDDSFAFCVGKGVCVNVSYGDLIGYLDLQNLRNPKLIKNTLIGLKGEKIVIVNYPKEAQIRDLEKVIKYIYGKNGQIKEIDIDLKRIGNIKIVVDKLLCEKD